MKFLKEFAKTNKEAEFWRKIAGKENFENTKFKILKNKIYIDVYERHIYMELNLYKKEYTKKLQENFENIEEVIIRLTKRPKKIVFKEEENIKKIKEKEKYLKMKINENIEAFKDIEDENKKSLLILSKSFKDVENFFDNKEKKCIKCGKIVYDLKKECILCYNQKIEIQKQKIKKRLYEDTIYTIEYAINIDKMEKEAYILAKDEVLTSLYKIFWNKYKKRERFEDEIRRYLMVLLQSEKEYILKMEKEKILEGIQKREFKYENF